METKKLFSRVGFGYVIFFVAAVAAQYLIIIALGLIVEYWLHIEISMEILMFVSQVAMYGCALPLLYLWLKRIPSWSMEKKQKISAGYFFLLIVFCFGITYMGNIVGQILMYATSLVSGIPVDNPVDSMVELLSPASLFLYVVIIAPLMEELVFRKLLIDRIIPYGQKTAVIVSGVTFGLFHGNFYQFFYACSIGMVFAYLYSKTGTIKYGVILHAIINFVGGFLSAILLRGMENESILAYIGMAMVGLLMVGSIISAIVLICLFAAKIKFFPGWAERPEKGFWKTILLAPGTLMYFLVCAVMFLFF